MRNRRLMFVGTLVAAILILVGSVALASSVATSVVDTTAPTGSVTIAPGGTAPININLSVTGSQVGTATFTVDTVWTLSGGTFTGSTPNSPAFTVGPRSGGDPATLRSTTGSVSVDCDQAPGTFTLAVDVENADISNSNPTGGKLESGNASNYSVTVAGAKHASCNDAPEVSVTGFNDGDSFELGDEPTPGCLVTDDNDINPTTTPQIDTSGLVGGLGTVTVTCSYTDGGGLEDSAVASYTVTPPPNTAPVVSVTGFNDGDTFEIGAEPTSGCSVEDAEDGNSTPDPTIDRTALSHGLGIVTVSCSYTDGGGLNGSDSANYTIVDTGDPTIEGAISAGTLGNNGWYTTFPTVTFTCADTGGSGIQSCVADGESGASKTLSGDGADQSVSGTAIDWAGNDATDTVSDIDVDTTDPTNIQFTGVGGPYYFGSVPAASTFGCTAEDATSLLDDCVVTGYSSSVGTHTLTATATDNAGNDATATTTYTVMPWTLNGFYSPVDASPTVNIVKGGSTVPLKFEAFVGTTELTDIAIVDTFKVVRTGCGSTTLNPDDIEQYSTGGTSLRYDATGGQFIQNWKTPATKNECYTVTLTLDDGSSKTALFKTK